MRAKITAALAAAALTGAALAAAGSAAAEEAPTGKQPVTAAAADRLRSIDLKDGASASGASIRLAGNDRYETAAEISRMFWEQDYTFAVYLASGTSFADALALGPSSSYLGPVLLTERDTLPASTRDELRRLRPCAVIVVGGDPSVSDAVVAEAERYVDTTAACGM